jgi:hypothetical protein
MSAARLGVEFQAAPRFPRWDFAQSRHMLMGRSEATSLRHCNGWE